MQMQGEPVFKGVAKNFGDFPTTPFRMIPDLLASVARL